MKDWNLLAQEAHERHFYHDSNALSNYSGGCRVATSYRNRLRLNRKFLEGRNVHGDSFAPQVAAVLSAEDDRG